MNNKLEENYFAYNSETDEYKTFTTEEFAKTWLEDSIKEGFNPDDFEGSYFGKITHIAKAPIIDSQDDYPCSQHDNRLCVGYLDKESCGDCEENGWPYDPDWVTAHKVEFVKAEKENPIKEVMNGLVQAFDCDTRNITSEDLEKSWFFKWNKDLSLEKNLYSFVSCLELYKYKCERWEERHNGWQCCVDRVVENYVIPKIRELCERLKPESKWISCKDELPQHTGIHIFRGPWCNGEIVDAAIYVCGKNYWIYSEEKPIPRTVTHWQPLPVFDIEKEKDCE